MDGHQTKLDSAGFKMPFIPETIAVWLQSTYDRYVNEIQKVSGALNKELEGRQYLVGNECSCWKAGREGNGKFSRCIWA